ncbi:DUF669 domain-containing protein [Tahibacter harae]|uniref:DUF669 domain-containing protein n=1 Tax=Tahibacter harae TaxID=2963937 RepID=A0ABT1QS68_9GAMM|nr:DUF669 domain-containing protein [Tahibacter harae]MCQ4165107.1 DUF669 domain-containing protein [Tahibacter harae]
MANIGFFDPSTVPPQQDFTPIPAGEYVAQIVDSEMKATKTNNGQYLNLTYSVLDGPYKGRLLWTRLNLDNPSAQTVQIAQQQLAAILHAVGLGPINDSAQLHHKPHLIRVEFVPAGRDRKGNIRERDSNEIRGWKKLEGQAPAGAGAQAQQQMPLQHQQPTQNQVPQQQPPQPAVSAGGRPAWAR